MGGLLCGPTRHTSTTDFLLYTFPGTALVWAINCGMLFICCTFIALSRWQTEITESSQLTEIKWLPRDTKNELDLPLQLHSWNPDCKPWVNKSSRRTGSVMYFVYNPILLGWPRIDEGVATPRVNLFQSLCQSGIKPDFLTPSCALITKTSFGVGWGKDMVFLHQHQRLKLMASIAVWRNRLITETGQDADALCILCINLICPS